MEEFQGGVCGGTWWNPPHNLFSGGLSSPCSVAQLGGGGFDMGNFGWQNDVIKGKVNNNNTIFDNLFFSDQLDSSLDILGLSSTTDWNNHQNLMCNNENNEANFGSIIQENMNNNTNHEDASPSMGMTASSNSSSGDSSTITSCEVVLPIPNTFQMINSSASYLIQSLFDDSDDQSQSIPHHDHQTQFLNNPITSNFGCLDSCNEIISSTNSWVNSLPDHHHNLHHQNSNQYPNIQSSLQSNKLDEGFNSLINGHTQVLNGQYSPTTLDNIRVSLLNSLQSRSRASFGTKVNSEDQHRRESKNNSSNKDQSPAKRPRIETPSPLPTFKVRKEKLGDRITALQQLVSPFGKTDTASVLHEAIEYIKFLHDQVNVLSTPYLKSGTAIQQQGCEKLKDNEGDNEDLRSKGLCLVPISSTYPMTQETPIDFWTPTFGGTTFR